MPLLDGFDAGAVRRAAAALAAGELVAFPTETVYGLGARAEKDSAVAGIFAAKSRPLQHPLIVHVADAAAATTFGELSGGGSGRRFGDVSTDMAADSSAAQRLIAAFWPGPLTLIVPRRSGFAEAASGGQPSIGLRMPSHPVALALLREAALLGVAGIAGPSANRHGGVSPTTAAHVQDEFGAALWVLDGGACAVGIESAIVDCTRRQPALLRPGQITRAQIEAALGQPLTAPDAASPRAAGTLASHYAPRARVVLFDTSTLQQQLLLTPPSAAVALASAGLHDAGSSPVIGVYSRVAKVAGPGWAQKDMPDDAAAAAHELFSVLRQFDAAGVAAIWVERPPSGSEWDGVRDRLQRAAA